MFLTSEPLLQARLYISSTPLFFFKSPLSLGGGNLAVTFRSEHSEANFFYLFSYKFLYKSLPMVK